MATVRLPLTRTRFITGSTAHTCHLRQLDSYLRVSTELMQVMARACGHGRLSKFCLNDLTTRDREMAHLTGIAYGGVRRDFRRVSSQRTAGPWGRLKEQVAADLQIQTGIAPERADNIRFGHQRHRYIDGIGSGKALDRRWHLIQGSG
jgi:hypothetical protein